MEGKKEGRKGREREKGSIEESRRGGKRKGVHIRWSASLRCLQDLHK